MYIYIYIYMYIWINCVVYIFRRSTTNGEPFATVMFGCLCLRTKGSLQSKEC